MLGNLRKRFCTHQNGVVRQLAWSLLNATLAKGIGFILLAMCIMLFSSIQSTASSNGEFEFEQGHWVGKSEWSDLGKFESCMVSLHNDEDVLLILRLDRNYSLTVGVFEKHWRNSSEPITDVTAQTDHKILYSGIGLLIESNTLSFEIEKPTQSIQLLGSSQYLRVAIDDEETIFDLTDSDQAMSFLKECLENGRKNTKYG